MSKIRKSFKKVANQQGFTLIEMAIVLIIIGIIIGAVIKGKDLIRSAEQKKIYTKYLNARASPMPASMIEPENG